MLPRPLLTWGQAYTVLGVMTDCDPYEATVNALTLVAALQGGEPVDQWLLEGLLGLAGVDLDDEAQLDFATSIAARMQGAGLLVVEGGWFSHALDSDAGAWGFRYRELVRLDLLHRLSAMESEFGCDQEIA